MPGSDDGADLLPDAIAHLGALIAARRPLHLTGTRDVEADVKIMAPRVMMLRLK